MTDLYFQNQLGTIFFDTLKPEDQRDPAAVRQAHDIIDTFYGLLEHNLTGDAWLVDDRFSMADCALVPALNYARMWHPYAGRQSIEAYWEKLSARPSVKRVLDEAAPYLEAFMKSMG